MPLFYQISNDTPFTEQEGLAVKFTAPPITAPKPASVTEFCYCNLECEYEEFAFYSEDGLAEKNDSSQFLFAKKKASDSIICELYKDDSLIAEINDDTYGKIYSGFTTKPLYKGYSVDWKKVADQHGNGRYNLLFKLDVLGNEFEIKTHYYKVLAFNQFLADKTVKIETFQNGNIIGSEFDFTDLLPDGWYNSVRINGRFGQRKPVFEKDVVADGRYIDYQIQSKIYSEWILEARNINSYIADRLFYRDITANRILITDYNLIAHDKYVQIDVVPEGNESVDYENRGTLCTQLWKFSDRVKNIIKTNY